MKTSNLKGYSIVSVLVMAVSTFTFGLLTNGAEAQQPKPGGIIRLGVSATPRQLDPAKQKQTEEYFISEMVFDSLTTIDREMRVWPALATSWEASKDMKTWTFHLRQGVQFHHGREVTVEDVIATLQRIKDPATGSPARTKLAVIERMEALDKYTVRFYLAFPYGQLHHLFVRHVSIVPKDKIDTLSTHPIGSGPFRFKEYLMGDRVIVVKNPESWQKDRYPLDGVELRIVSEPAVAMTSLERGELDAYYDVPRESIATLKERKNINISSALTGAWDVVAMRNDQPPFNDLRVRQALFYCTNRDELVKGVLFGYGEPTHSPVPPGHPLFNKSLPFVKQDFNKAKKLLADAGHPNGLEIGRAHV
jgi:peptide/nickel transport system substrate-binding protein